MHYPSKICNCSSEKCNMMPKSLNPQHHWPYHKPTTNINSLLWFKQPFLHGHQVLKITVLLWGLRRQDFYKINIHPGIQTTAAKHWKQADSINRWQYETRREKYVLIFYSCTQKQCVAISRFSMQYYWYIHCKWSAKYVSR